MDKSLSYNSKSSSERPQVRLVKVSEETVGQRIDNFLIRELAGVPKGRLYKAIRKGEVRVNGGRIRQTYRLAAGDEVRLPPLRVAAEREPQITGGLSERLLGSVVFEDKRVLVINKPSGIAVHGGSGISAGVIEGLRAARPDLAELGLVHRLDRETSGVLVMAKRRSALRSLHAAFREGRVSKRYLAACVGHWPFGERSVDLALEVRNRAGGERHVVADAGGKAALTHFAPQAFYDGFTVLSAEPETGRTHQIRVHAEALGHPLAMDVRYGDDDANRVLKRRGLKRLFLHAQSIGFADESGNEQLFSAPLADDLEAWLGKSRRQQ